MEALTKLDLPFPHIKSGKVREVYDLGEHYLFVATDRISAFDVVLPNGIPRKGEVLNKLSLFWFEMFKDIINNHIEDVFPDELGMYPELERRSAIVTKANPFPVECIVRGYLAGSGWKEYQKTGEVCGIILPEGLIESSKLSEPIFTPATKEEMGKHDINISLEKMGDILGKDLAYHLRDRSIELYTWAAEYALQREIIIADTKFEFGDVKGDGVERKIILIIDEVSIVENESSARYPQHKSNVQFESLRTYVVPKLSLLLCMVLNHPTYEP